MRSTLTLVCEALFFLFILPWHHLHSLFIATHIMVSPLFKMSPPPKFPKARLLFISYDPERLLLLRVLTASLPFHCHVLLIRKTLHFFLSSLLLSVWVAAVYLTHSALAICFPLHVTTFAGCWRFRRHCLFTAARLCLLVNHK